MTIDDLTIKEAREIPALINGTSNNINTECPFKVGSKYFIRTCTYHLVGMVAEICGNFLVLEKAAWVADSGRFMQAIDNGTLDEVEPMGDGVFVSIGAIVDAIPWAHDLPLKQK